ncbi:MAG: YfcE family phosphodiesterase [Candidatus Omnitrophica bacterium]|nr:YfcE family phosphodiesterase [Candidatus Omnitrophota bacterium]
MKVLVLSDTHIPTNADTLPERVIEEAKKCDCIVHAGDFVSSQVLEQLEKFAKTYGVAGNMDGEKIRRRLPKKQVFQLEEILIGLFHGRGSPFRIVQTVEEEFSDASKDIDMYIFGHSHVPYHEKKGGKIFFNPGSATDSVFAPYPSFGLLEIHGNSVNARIEKIG